jgi:hypothetical protein
MRYFFLINGEHIEPFIVSGCQQIPILLQAQHPVPLIGLFVTVDLYFGLDIPNTNGFVLGIADEVATFWVENHA